MSWRSFGMSKTIVPARPRPSCWWRPQDPRVRILGELGGRCGGRSVGGLSVGLPLRTLIVQARLSACSKQINKKPVVSPHGEDRKCQAASERTCG
jgi:hypothetical protein